MLVIMDGESGGEDDATAPAEPVATATFEVVRASPRTHTRFKCFTNLDVAA